jgi:hypothetical protein
MSAPIEMGKVESTAQAIKEAFQRYAVHGTSDNPSGYGPPYRAPWFLIDVSTAEPEVNWPGELIGEFTDAQAACDEHWRMIARSILARHEPKP